MCIGEYVSPSTPSYADLDALAIGRWSRNMGPSSIQSFPRPGCLIVSATGHELIPRVGRELKTKLGGSVHSITDGGYSSERLGDGCPVPWLCCQTIRPLWLPFWQAPTSQWGVAC